MSENQENAIKDASQLIGQISKLLSDINMMAGDHVLDTLKSWAESSSVQILEWNKVNATKAITSEGESKASAKQRLLDEFANTLYVLGLEGWEKVNRRINRGRQHE